MPPHNLGEQKEGDLRTVTMPVFPRRNMQYKHKYSGCVVKYESLGENLH